LRAGTVIFAMSIIVWALGTFPRDEKVVQHYEQARARATSELSGAALATRLGELKGHEEARLLERSALGRMGKLVEPAVRPLGWDWRIGMSVLASFPAREIVVSTLGVIFDLGHHSTDDEEAGLTRSIKGAKRPDGAPLFTLAVALSLMVFFALCAQCMATLAMIRRETNSWRWPLFTFGYMTFLAYVGALATYQIGVALGL
jgi:ferrous iron transport protein B